MSWSHTSQKHTLYMTITSTFLRGEDKSEETNWPPSSPCFRQQLINTCQTSEPCGCFSFLSNYGALWINRCLHAHTHTHAGFASIFFFFPAWNDKHSCAAVDFEVISYAALGGGLVWPSWCCSQSGRGYTQAGINTLLNPFASLQSLLIWGSLYSVTAKITPASVKSSALTAASIFLLKGGCSLHHLRN